MSSTLILINTLILLITRILRESIPEQVWVKLTELYFSSLIILSVKSNRIVVISRLENGLQIMTANLYYTFHFAIVNHTLNILYVRPNL